MPMIAIKNPYIIEKAGHLAIMATDNIWILRLYHNFLKLQTIERRIFYETYK